MEQIKRVKLLEDTELSTLMTKINYMCENEHVINVDIHNDMMPAKAYVTIGTHNRYHSTLLTIFFQMAHRRFNIENPSDRNLIQFLTYYLQSISVFVCDGRNEYQFQEINGKTMSIQLEADLFNDVDLTITYQHDVDITNTICKLIKFHKRINIAPLNIQTVFDVYRYFENADNNKQLKSDDVISKLITVVESFMRNTEKPHICNKDNSPTKSELILHNWAHKKTSNINDNAVCCAIRYFI